MVLLPDVGRESRGPTRRTRRRIDDVRYYRWDYASDLPSSTQSGWMSSVKFASNSAPLLSISGLITKSPDDTRAQGRCFLGSVSLYSIPPDVYSTPRYTFIHDLCPPDFPLSSKCPQLIRQLALPPITLPQYLTLPQSSIKP